MDTNRTISPMSDVPQWTLADRLRKIRRDRHLTQEQIARELGVKGVTWSAWEAGRTRPHDVVELAGLIEQRFGVPAAWTLGVLNQATPAPRKAVDNGTVSWGRRQTDFLTARMSAGRVIPLGS
jgi:transcriptional regulator with XRE-family HTH domain